MTEYNLFVDNILIIAEIAVRCRKMDGQKYNSWKQEVMDSAPETTRKFMRKVLIVIDSIVLEGGVA